MYFFFNLQFQTTKKFASLESGNTTNSHMKACDTAIDNMSKLTEIIRSLNNQLENNSIYYEDSNTNIPNYTQPDISKCNYYKSSIHHYFMQ